MKNKFVIHSLIGLFLILLACTDKDQTGTYFGKNIDDSIISTWNTSYISRDLNNGITVYNDTLTFKSNNHGDHKVYEFNTLDFSHFFQFYTEDNSLTIKYDQIEDEVHWSYTIRNDSLILEGNRIYIK
jgi:hypothetical protein